MSPKMSPKMSLKMRGKWGRKEGQSEGEREVKNDIQKLKTKNRRGMIAKLIKKIYIKISSIETFFKSWRFYMSYKEGEAGASDAPNPLLKPPSWPQRPGRGRPFNTQKSSTAKILNSLIPFAQTAKFFNAFELFAYCLINLLDIC